ncbi:MAG: D-tyrosyl-tRNA(Tyr) deacylase [Candidatus Cloacimonetes bacterium]|nr:D-tyrosyl-tRNA(Tyr) deacylase [Candidatus Cloacimonadota bacterium]
MKVVIQRVEQTVVKVADQVIASMGKGLLLLLGIAAEDDGNQIPWLAKKIVELRIFPDQEGKMNLSVKDIGGEILLVSQFTLCANTDRGRRPDFFIAAEPEKAEKLYEEFALELEKHGIKPKLGSFGAYMKISLTNDGPVTFVLER